MWCHAWHRLWDSDSHMLTHRLILIFFKILVLFKKKNTFVERKNFFLLKRQTKRVKVQPQVRENKNKSKSKTAESERKQKVSKSIYNICRWWAWRKLTEGDETETKQTKKTRYLSYARVCLRAQILVVVVDGGRGVFNWIINSVVVYSEAKKRHQPHWQYVMIRQNQKWHTCKLN